MTANMLTLADTLDHSAGLLESIASRMYYDGVANADAIRGQVAVIRDCVREMREIMDTADVECQEYYEALDRGDLK